MAALEPHFFSQTCSINSKNDSIENSVLKVDNHLEKVDFADLLKDAKSVAGFSPSCQVKQNDVT